MKKLCALLIATSLLLAAFAYNMPQVVAGSRASAWGSPMQIVINKNVISISDYTGNLPDSPNQAQGFYFQTTYIITAHSYLAGTNFYNLRPGDKVTVIYANQATRTFEVMAIGKIHGDYPTRDDPGFYVGNRHFAFWDMFALYSYPYGITLYTCLASDNGLGATGGRLFIELVPTEN